MTEHTDIELRRDVSALTTDDLKKLYSIASALALSKRFPDAQTADQAYAKVLLGHDLGLSPTQALTGLHIVEGRPQIAAVTLAGFVRKHPHYEYEIEEHTEKICRIAFWFGGDGKQAEIIGHSSFTIEEAKTAGLVKERSNWVKWPKNMLFARAMSNGVKWFCPDLMGGVPIYTEADTFEGTATEVTAGDGDGQPVGWQGISVGRTALLEDILKRAEARGHAGLANRAAVEMIVNGQTDDFIDRWIDTANDELSRMKVTPERAQEVADVILDAAEVMRDVPEDDTGALTDREALESRRHELLDAIVHYEAEPDDTFDVEDLRAELADLESLLGPAPIPGQEEMDL